MASPVPMGQCGGAVPAVGSEDSLDLAFTDSHDLGSLGDGKLVFQNAVKHLNPGLFLLIQLYIPHGDDIVADQLAGDRIVDHQQIFRSTGSKFLAIYTARFTARFVPSSTRSPPTISQASLMSRNRNHLAWSTECDVGVTSGLGVGMATGGETELVGLLTNAVAAERAGVLLVSN